MLLANAAVKSDLLFDLGSWKHAGRSDEEEGSFEGGNKRNE
jgi:hypothetical protein